MEIRLTDISVAFCTKVFMFKKLPHKHVPKNSSLFILSQVISTFILVSIAWIFFKAPTIDKSYEIIYKIITDWGAVFIDKTNLSYGFFSVLVLIGIEFYQERRKNSVLPYPSNHWIIEHFYYSILLIIILMIGVLDGNQFIYFQF